MSNRPSQGSSSDSQKTRLGVEDIEGDITLTDITLGEAHTSKTPSLESLPCSQYGEDISDLILQYDPGKLSSSTKTLGKRKAPPSLLPFAPSKTQKFNHPEDDENPFLDHPKPAEPTHTTPILVAYDRLMQKFFDSRGLPFGVQYEIARLVSNGTLDFGDIFITALDKLKELGCNAKAAPETERILCVSDATREEYSRIHAIFTDEISAKFPWVELDKEEEAIRLSEFNGLGCNEDYPDWHGGQVHFRGSLGDLTPKGKNASYKITVERAELGPSDRFGRRFGSKAFFRLKVPKELMTRKPDALFRFVIRPIVLCNHVFQAFYAKDTTVFYVRTNKIYDGETDRILPHRTVEGVQSLESFLNWHNDIRTNCKQSMAKYAARFALGLSNSQPGLQVNREDIIETLDIVSDAKSDMTDGAGLINKTALLYLRNKFVWDIWPTAIQVRLFGAKGLLVQHPTDSSDQPRVWLRPSLIKIRYPNSAPDPSNLIIDVLRHSHARSPCRLSAETIVNLAENGVPRSAFVKLLTDGLQKIVQSFMNWEGGPEAMRELWRTLCHAGGVMPARRAREDPGSARIKGHSERDVDDLELDNEDEPKALEPNLMPSTAWWPDETSGCPSSLEETVMYLLDAGFTPFNCLILREKLKNIVRTQVRNYVKSYRFEVPMSVTAFLVPDVLDVLEPGEVFFKSSRRILLSPDGREMDLLTGDVLVTRHPCKLPSDTQKFKAVDRPCLHYLTDVLVFSIKGPRRVADYLAGGDYDGDKGLVIYDPALVDPFQNAPLDFSVEPPDMANNFSKKNTTVAEFLERTASLDEDERNREKQYFLLGALRDTARVGMYSNFHDNSTYLQGYQHPETIRLAYMFTMTLDGAKTGLTVRPEVLKRDFELYNKRPPEWKEQRDDVDSAWKETNAVNLRRAPTMPTFIMDHLNAKAKELGTIQLSKLEHDFNTVGHPSASADQDLIRPYLDAVERGKRAAADDPACPRLTKDLEKITDHVRTMWQEHRTKFQASPTKKSTRKSPSKGASSFTDQPIQKRQDNLRALSLKFASRPGLDEVIMSEGDLASIRASYAYVYDLEQRQTHFAKKWTSFPWDVAMRELCLIKCRANKNFKPVNGGFYSHFSIKQSAKR